MTIFKNFKKIYCIGFDSSPAVFALYEEIKNAMLDPELDRTKFERNFRGFRSCNDAYISELFGDWRILKLYELHHEVAVRGDLYFTKFSKFKDMSLDESAKEKIRKYCERVYLKNIEGMN